MATPSEKLAASLAVLNELQDQGIVAIRSSHLTRTHRERLLRTGFIQEVMKGWYIPSRPDEPSGESTAWYASFWRFCAEYLEARFGDQWCLSPEQSLNIHTETRRVPAQLLVRSPKSGNKPIALLHNTSIFDVRLELPAQQDREVKDQLRIMTLPAALIACNASQFISNPVEMRAALAMVSDASDLLRKLLDGGHSKIAGRLAGAFRNIGRTGIADQITGTMKSAGYTVSENDPFNSPSPALLTGREQSPYVNRIRLMWASMRPVVIDQFPQPPTKKPDPEAYLKQIEDLYVTDAYHSLSIEGYRVSPDLIERVRTGRWNPQASPSDAEHHNALAARGYWLAHEEVKKSIRKILSGENAGQVAETDLNTWYRELFAPSVTAGILRPGDLAGYRNQPVYIRNSMHTPPNADALRDTMPTFYELLSAETEASVRTVLGHFVFVYLHPFMDGNGRIGRFLMNAMLASGGYPWTVITLAQRDAYMSALEQASVHQNIEPFTRVIADSF